MKSLASLYRASEDMLKEKNQQIEKIQLKYTELEKKFESIQKSEITLKENVEK